MKIWKIEDFENRIFSIKCPKGGENFWKGLKTFTWQSSTFQLFPEQKIVLLSYKLIPVAFTSGYDSVLNGRDPGLYGHIEQGLRDADLIASF